MSQLAEIATVVGLIGGGGLVALGCLYILFRSFQRGLEEDVVSIVTRVVIEHQLSGTSHPDIRAQLAHISGSVTRIEGTLNKFIEKLDEKIASLPCLDPNSKHNHGG